MEDTSVSYELKANLEYEKVREYWTKVPVQAVQTYIRLLIVEQSDQDLYWLTFNQQYSTHC